MKKGASQGAKKSDFVRLLSYTEPYGLMLALALLCLLLGTGLGLVYPGVVQRFIDALFITPDSSKINRYGSILVGVFILQALFAFARSYLLAYVGENVVADVRKQIFGHLLELPVSFFATRRVGELLSRSASDVGVIQGFLTGALTEFIRQTLLLIGGIAIIAIMSPNLTLMMLAIVPPMFILANRYGRYIRRLSIEVQDRIADSNAVIQEALSAIPVVQLFVREDYERKRYAQKVESAVQIAIKRAIAGGGFVAVLILTVYGGIGGVLWIGSRMVLSQTMTAGELMAFILYTFIVGMSISSMAGFYGQLQQATGATSRVFELIDTIPTIKDNDDAEKLPNPSGYVEFDQVHFAYPGDRDKEVIKGISISTRKGEVVALVGPSGAGKSTLVSLLPRFYDVTSGVILVDGRDVRRIKLSDLRGIISAVPQETVLFGGTIRQNIAYGKLEASNEEIEAASRAAHAHEFITDFPQGYETVVGERGVQLSGGQRQRIAIARALLKDPAILILDEATSSLDSESERLIQEALQNLMQGRTTFVIAHRLSTVRRADRIIYLEDGAIVEEGTHEELQALGGKYKQLCDMQFKDTSSPEDKVSSIVV